MVKEYELIDPRFALSLREELTALPDAYWVDRSVHYVNTGLHGEVGKYLSMGDRAMPPEILETLQSIAPEKDIPLTEVVVNKYRKGDFLPKHIDEAGPAHCVLLSLADSSEGLSTEDGVIPDRAGWVKEIPLSLIHWVEPVVRPRFTVIFLYDRNFR